LVYALGPGDSQPGSPPIFCWRRGSISLTNFDCFLLWKKPRLQEISLRTPQYLTLPKPTASSVEIARTIVEVDHVDFHYRTSKALHVISLQIPETKVTAFIGPPACGCLHRSALTWSAKLALRKTRDTPIGGRPRGSPTADSASIKARSPFSVTFAAYRFPLGGFFVALETVDLALTADEIVYS
jgi:hypothetical protein